MADFRLNPPSLQDFYQIVGTGEVVINRLVTSHDSRPDSKHVLYQSRV